MWLMKTLLTSRCINQRGAGQYWYQKYDVTFCLSFQLSGYNPSIAISDLEAFLHYLESGKLVLPTLGFAVISKHNTNINHVHAVCRFISYLISTYVSPRYMDGTPKELSRYASQLSKRLSTYRADFRPSKQKHSHRLFNSLTSDMVRKFYEIIRPESSSKPNPINPFPAGEIQFRNYLICRLLLNYGLRVSELLLLEKHSIKPNIQGGQFSIIVTSLDDDVRDPRKRLPSLKNSWAHRVLALDINDYSNLKIYIDKIRKNTSHSFIFTSTKNNSQPLSYHSVYDIFSKIDSVFKKEHPQFSDEKNIDSIVSITPHVTRHTWAYLILKRVYADKYQSVMKSCKLTGVDFAIAGLMSEAKDELRLLGGWSHNSRMPEFYARRFLSERANFSNITRIAADSTEDDFSSSIHQAFRETIK